MFGDTTKLYYWENIKISYLGTSSAFAIAETLEDAIHEIVLNIDENLYWGVIEDLQNDLFAYLYDNEPEVWYNDFGRLVIRREDL